MAATKYQIFFRYINPTTQIAITNDLSSEYSEAFDIIHGKHKIYVGTDSQQLEAEEERDQMVIQGNSSSCDKFDMLFVFGGTKKYLHKDWDPDSQKWIERTGMPIAGTGKPGPSGYPYVIKDYYLRIPMSPWIKGSCYGSLEAAIDKCRELANAIGIANIKLVKVVAVGQKIKIQ